MYTVNNLLTQSASHFYVQSKTITPHLLSSSLNTIRYDTIRKKNLTCTQKLSD